MRNRDDRHLLDTLLRRLLCLCPNFVIFDVETVFLYPWAVAYRNLGLFALIEMFIFIGILALGLVYAWRKKALEWQ